MPVLALLLLLSPRSVFLHSLMLLLLMLFLGPWAVVWDFLGGGVVPGHHISAIFQFQLESVSCIPTLMCSRVESYGLDVVGLCSYSHASACV